VWQSWSVLLVAARCCTGLLRLTVHTHNEHGHARRAAFAAPPVLASPLLPELIALTLHGDNPPVLAGFDDFSVLRHFTAPPHAQLRHVDLQGHGLSAQHVLSLASLPRLSRLEAYSLSRNAEVEEAHRRTRLLTRGAAATADRDVHSPTACREDWEGERGWSSLGPHQRQEMRQRVIDETMVSQTRGLSWDHDLLACAEGMDADTVRAVFFGELRSVLEAAAAS
jgi:hypothetical protein